MTLTTDSSPASGGAANGRSARGGGETHTPISRKNSGGRDLLQALPWIGPALILIFGVVFFPAGLMFFNSTRDISQSGIDKGSVGFDNYATVFGFAEFWPILLRTIIWVIVVVTFTVALSLVVAQVLNKAFPGRKLVRLAVIVPWAASVVMTTMVFYYGLEPYFGIINKFLVDVGLIDTPEGFGWTRNADTAFAWSMAIAVFVSLPFTTYTILAGLQAIPGDTLEAARVDGAGPAHTYFAVVLPQLRSALAVAILINIINVFNSLPILRIMTGSIPGYSADTIMTMIFKYMQDQHKVDVASALSVIGFLIVMVIVAIYVKAVKPMKEV
ncbi:multiple sugar transport system permease protein [Leucobacter exalbidus]|uniref:Multiple sugar transport system permease protein n=1 Tax=Leucobacter exalbidus TaxID=662960 RepID=A0A940T4I7_9MICO|nr:sugar ABC transporter permease [Leucobacter exalbidus]MBP1326973.1 multiple sugar transport system permease protein [Leucobacter exalbidus]